MNRGTKTFLIIFSSLAVGVGGFFLVRKIRKTRGFGQTGGFFKNNRKGNVENTLDNAENYGSTTSNDSKFNPHPFAERLLLSMQGAGTDEQAFFGVYDELNTNEAQIVNKYFDDMDIGKGYSLRQWVDGDFGNWYDSEATYQKALRLIAY